MSQLLTITIHKGEDLYLRWPYQAKVIKILEITSRRMVDTLIYFPNSKITVFVPIASMEKISDILNFIANVFTN
jgi:hypothetical protein